MTPSIDATPLSWRVASMTVLLGGIAVGDRAAGGGRARLAAMALCGVVAATVPPIMRAGRRVAIERAQPDAARVARAPGDPPRFTVIVAARDEAAVIGSLVADVAAQRLPDAAGRPDLELILIDDRSVDGTADVARAAADAAGIADRFRVIRRDGDDLPDGKGAALTAAQPGDCAGATIVVLDADAHIGPGFLAALERPRAAGIRAMTARRRTVDAETSWLAGAQADEQAVDGAIQAGRWALGGMSEFRGNGIVIDRTLLAEAGGWRAHALTEDLDLSSRIGVTAGERVAFNGEADVWEQPVRSVEGLWRQRLRWAEGSLRRYLEHGPTVLRSTRLSALARLDFAAYGGQLLSPPIIIGAVIGAIRRRRPGVAAGLIATYAAASGALVFEVLAGERDEGGRPLSVLRRARRGARMAAFSTIWLGALPASLWRLATRRGPVAYDKMVHDAVTGTAGAGRSDGRPGSTETGGRTARVAAGERRDGVPAPGPVAAGS